MKKFTKNTNILKPKSIDKATLKYLDAKHGKDPLYQRGVKQKR
jgi:hypothetical protein